MRRKRLKGRQGARTFRSQTEILLAREGEKKKVDDTQRATEGTERLPEKWPGRTR